MKTYLALIQLGQRQHQSARYLGYRSKKLVSQQDGRMKKTFAQFYDRHIQGDFSNCLFKWNLLFLYLYVYVVLFTQETYMVLIMHKTILTRLRKSWLINYFFIHSLKSLFIREDWGLIRREFTVNLNSCLFLFLKYRCPSAILKTIYMRLVQK